MKNFECPKSIKSIKQKKRKKYMEHQTLGRRFVCPIVQATQHNMGRLTNFYSYWLI